MTRDPQDRLVVDALGRAVPPVTPPSELRARVLAAAAREPIEPRDTATTDVDSPAPPRATGTPARQGTSSLWPWLAAAAATIVAVGTSLGWISARGEVARLQATIESLRANATALLNVRAEFERERTDRERAAAILSAADVTYTALDGVAPAGTARARAYISPSRGLFFAAEGLPPLPDGRTYQLWTIVRGAPVSHGVFDLPADGRAQVLAQAPPGPIDAVAVTIEPAGGVPAPTGDKVLVGLPAN